MRAYLLRPFQLRAGQVDRRQFLPLVEIVDEHDDADGVGVPSIESALKEIIIAHYQPESRSCWLFCYFWEDQ